MATDWENLGVQAQATWDNFLDVIGDDPAWLMIVGTTVLVIVTYWSYAAIFTIIDMTNPPRRLLKYRIQPDQNIPVDMQKLWKSVRQVLFNQLVITPIFLYACYSTRSWTPATMRQLPSLKTYLIDVGLMALLEEPIFYYVHRLQHHRSIYKYVHKKHHEWTAPVAAMTFYCHPLDHIVSNLGPIGFSAVLINAHITVAWTFAVLAIVVSMTDHTGYTVRSAFYKTPTVFHDYHHAKFNYNFGVYGWLDKVHGTFRDTSTECKAKGTQVVIDGNKMARALKKQK